MMTGALLALGVWLVAQAPSPAAPLPAPEAVQRGAQLFSGQVRFFHRGAACIACHSAAGLPFPNGGTLGPDLTHVTSRMGAAGVQAALETLYFPAMVPLYKTKPLTAEERQDLAAFLQHADASAPPAATGRLAALAGLIFVVLMLAAWWIGRGRLRGVRRQLLANARAAASRGPRAEKVRIGAPE